MISPRCHARRMHKRERKIKNRKRFFSLTAAVIIMGSPEHHHHKRSTKAGMPANSKVEAALGAGRKYEKPLEGQNKWYDDFHELEAERIANSPHYPTRQSRGARIDKELEQEDKRTLAEREAARQQSQRSRSKSPQP